MTRKDSRPLLVLAAVSLACALGTGCSSGDDDSAPCKDCVYPATGGSSPSPIPTQPQVGSGQQAPPTGNTGGDTGTGGVGTGGSLTGGSGGAGGTVGGAFGGTGGTDAFTTGGTLGVGGTVASGGSGGTVGNTFTGGTANGATGGI